MTPLTLTHLFWSCPIASTFWMELLARWCGARVAANLPEQDRLFAVFSRQAPRLKSALFLVLAEQDGRYTVVQAAASDLWRTICTIAMHHLWLRRNEAAFQAVRVPATGLIRSLWNAVETQLQIVFTPRAATTTTTWVLSPFSEWWSTLTTEPEPPTSPPVEVRLYFDGGSRGNPGLTGGGCALLERTSPSSDWALVWWSAPFFGTLQTNNYAEHAALAEGVAEYARRYHETPTSLHVFGDSLLVLRQITGQAQVYKRSLQRISDRTIQILGSLPDVELHHTLRAGNKLTDTLANFEVDNQFSTAASTTWTAFDSNLTQLIPSDTTFPTTVVNNHPTQDLLITVHSWLSRRSRLLTPRPPT